MRSHSLWLLLLLAGCGATPTPPPEVLEMEDMILEPDPSAPGGVRAIDAQGLFEEGNDAFARQDYEACDRFYGLLLERFAQSRYVHSALYNRGLCLEQLRQYGQAAAHFRRHAQLSSELKDQRDGEFRMGYNLVKTGNYPEAEALYTELLKGADLGPADRAECHLRRGSSRLGLGRHGEAERDLKAAVSYIKEAYGEVTVGNDLLAESLFKRGELYQKLSHGVRLKLPVDKMQGDLADKAKFFRQAQDSFIDTLNVRHAYWATAAGMKLGELYEQFYMDVMEAEVPPDFDEQTKFFYVLELKKALKPLLEQSLTIYEKNITLSERLGAHNEWVDETEQRLIRLRGLLEETERAEAADAAAKPDAAKPDAAKPDAAKPDAAKPDAAKPDAAKPDAAKPDAAKPDAAKPDAGVPK